MSKSILKPINLLLEKCRISIDPSLDHFSRLLRQHINFLKQIRLGSKNFILLESQYDFYWAVLFPERFIWHPSSLSGCGPGYVLKEGEAVGKREKAVILGLLTSPTGRSFLFLKMIKELWCRFEFRLRCREEVSRDIDALIDSLLICPLCGEIFVGKRKGQRFCSDACRKKAHAVPSSERKDPATIRIYFYRKVNEGYSREDAWEKTRKRHGETLKALGLDGPQPPRTWAQNGTKKADAPD